MNEEPLPPALYRWPESAKFGRVVPKTKFYEHGNVRTTLREKFVNEIQRITWSYKLAESTVRLRGTEAVPEVQVFTVEAKGGNVSDDVLAAIDRSVRFPILFEVTKGDELRMVATHKTLGASSPKLGVYLSTAWLPRDTIRAALPTALDLSTLYEALLGSLLPVARLRGESLLDVTERMGRAGKLEREISALERKLRAEPQLNRKIEFRRQITQRTALLAELTAAAPSNKE